MRSWGWGCHDGISAFIKRGRDCCLSVKWGHSEKRPIYNLDGEFSLDTEFPNTSILDSPVSRILKNKHLILNHLCMHTKSLHLCPTPCDPKGYSPPGSSVHGLLQVRILEWVAISFSRGVFPMQGLKLGPLIAGRFFAIWAPREGL